MFECLAILYYKSTFSHISRSTMRCSTSISRGSWEVFLSYALRQVFITFYLYLYLYLYSWLKITIKKRKVSSKCGGGDRCGGKSGFEFNVSGACFR